MPTNVTQKDQTLQAVIDYCQRERDRVKPYLRGDCYVQYDDPAWNGGKFLAFNAVIEHCQQMLGYSGSMPLEVENQSEDAK